MDDFIKTKDHQKGISSPFGCVVRESDPQLEEGFACCTICNKRHMVITNCKGDDFVCSECHLDNCPFCDSQPDTWPGAAKRHINIQCRSKKCEVNPHICDFAPKAAKAWNTRAG